MNSYCVRCQSETNHDSVATYEKSYRDEYMCDDFYFIVKCKGCEQISFRHEFHDIEGGHHMDDEHDNWYVPITTKIYPNFLKNHKPIEEIYYIPETVKELYLQSISAYKEGANILAGLGFRGIIEAICNEQDIGGDNLQERIAKLVKQGIISKLNGDLLHAIRFLGNDAAHKIKNPSNQQLKVVLRIIEHMINSLYILEREAEGVIETVITSYMELEPLIKASIEKFKTGDELVLRELLGRDFRRVLENLHSIETDLIDAINSGKQSLLKIGKIISNPKKNVSIQHYIVN